MLLRLASRSSSAAVLTAVALTVAGCGAGAEPTPPASDPPYAAAVIAPAGSTLAILGGIEGTGDDTASAARAALETLASRLAEVGLDSSNVLRVRAALAPAGADDFAGWNTAWTSFFGAGHRPARVTVGATAVPGTARIVLDVVAGFPEGPLPSSVVDPSRPTANDNVRIAGSETNPTAIVNTASGLYLSAGVLPNRDALADPESMEQHIAGAIETLGDGLTSHNLRWSDTFFVRVLATPQPERPTVDFAGWEPVLASLREPSKGFAGAWTMWASPGFSAGGRYVEIEVWAAPASPHEAFQEGGDSANALLRMTANSPTAMISSGALIAPGADLILLSGIIAPEGTSPEEEGPAVLAVMEERLEALGASMADVAELRVYRVEGENTFNTAYGSYFNNAEVNPHRPVRTNYLVQSLPMGRLVEIEAIVARRAAE
jgi:enamine deaminase RidA (YjgF/YER057c/UK114 family)